MYATVIERLENLIFLDTEFSSLDVDQAELLSIGLVKPDGEALYRELEYAGPVSSWVEDHVLPMLDGPKVSKTQLRKDIVDFVGATRPYALSYVSQYDTILIYRLFGIDEHPFYWLPLDFASILVGLGYDPEVYARGDEEFFRELDLDPSGYREHHALDDARLLRDVYMRLQQA